MKLIVTQQSAPSPDEADFQIRFTGLKPGRQQAAAQFLSLVASTLEDGKIDMFEAIALGAGLKQVTR